jgi:hypothetical protein
MALFGGFQERREKKALEHYLTTPSIDATQIDELKKACPQAPALLHGILKGPSDRDKRFRALLGLESLGITGDMVPAVLEALRDEDEFVQESAAKVLGTYRQYSETVVPALVAAYTENASSRPLVLQILGEYGPDAHAAARVLRDGLLRPTEALAVARCLSRIGSQDLDALEQAMVDVLSDHKNVEDIKRLGPAFESRLEGFLLSCVPWRTVDAIPAWRRVLEAYADVCERPAKQVLHVLNELVQYSDWKLRGEVGAQFLEMSRAKIVAEKLVHRQAGPAA